MGVPAHLWLYDSNGNLIQGGSEVIDRFRVSDGCITFCNQADFELMRKFLLATSMQAIPSSTLKAYGELNVIGMRRA